MSMLKLERMTFQTSRAAEYFDARELQAQTGQPVSNFATVALKEIVDNALDACEMADVAPEVGIAVREEGGLIRLSVSDNGPGIPPDVVRKVLNFDTRISDKAAYRSPTRGAQGNALKTVVGLPHALGCLEPLIIEARGIRHQIVARVDPAGELRIDHDEDKVNGLPGTRVSLAVPAEGQEFDPDHWARGFALFNPHASVKIGAASSGPYRAKTAEGEDANFYQATASFPGGKFRKFLPTDLPSPHWYDVAALEKLVFSHISDHRSGGDDPLLRDFVRTFKGLSANAKAKIVCDRFPEIKRLSDFENRQELLPALLAAMQEQTTAPKPDVLGLVGRDHYRTLFEKWYGIERFWYQKATGEVDGIPYAFEVAVAQTEEKAGLFTAVNFSPTFEDPLASTPLRTEKFTAYGMEGFLTNAHASPYPNYYWGINPVNTVVAVHLITPAPEFLDRGKTRLKVQEEVASAIDTALWKVTKTLYKEEEKRRKDAARQQKADRDRRRAIRAYEPSLKEAVFAVMEEAVERATGGGSLPTSARNLYYQVRPLIQRYTTKALKYEYFSQELLTQYQEQHGPIPGLYYDPRGTLYEPHTEKGVPLGTREVEGYRFPVWLYDKILYIEKKGLWPVLREARLAERHDMAVVAAEGYATEAARILFENAEQDRDYQLFVLHDADPHGYNIARTLREETRRMPDYNVDVVDLGLKLEEALDMGLQTEEFTRKKELPETLLPCLTETEWAYFEGEKTDRKSWICERIELNAMTSPQLVEYIERKLNEKGVRSKVIPPEDELSELADELCRRKLTDWAEEALLEVVSFDEITKELTDEFVGEFELGQAKRYIEEGFEEDRALSWRDALAKKLNAIQKGHADALKDALRLRITEKVKGSG